MLVEWWLPNAMLGLDLVLTSAVGKVVAREAAML